MKRVLISGWYGNGNLGDEALLRGLIHAVRAASENIECIVLSDAPDETARTACVSAVGREGNRLWAETKAIASSDAFVLGGGGLIKDYGPAPGTAETWLKPLVIARLLGKRTMTFGVGVDELRFRASRRRVRQALRFSEVTAVRDRESEHRLREVGVRRRVVVTADPALLIGTPYDAVREPLIAVNVREWFSRGRSVERPDLVAALEGKLAAALDTLVETWGVGVVFVPFRDVSADSDASACQRVLERMVRRDAAVLEGVPSPEGAVALLARCEFVVGTRLHSLILAAAVGTPFAGLAYMPKISGFVNDATTGALTVGLEEGARAGSLAARLTQLYESRCSIAEQLRKTVPILRHRVLLNGRLVAALVHGDRELERATLDELRASEFLLADARCSVRVSEVAPT